MVKIKPLSLKKIWRFSSAHFHSEFGGDENVSDVTIKYTNGEAEYYSEQASYMPVVQDQYNDGGAETIKEIIGEFLLREEGKTANYLVRRQSEEDWNADAADTLEDG